MARPSLASLNSLADLLYRVQPAYDVSHNVLSEMEKQRHFGFVAQRDTDPKPTNRTKPNPSAPDTCLQSIERSIG